MAKTISTILNLQDRMSPKILKASDKIKGLDKDAQRATQKIVNMGNRFSSVADKMAAKAVRITAAGAGILAAGAAAGSVQLIKQSDAYAGIQARLSLISDGQQTVAEFNEKIFKSADDARMKYDDLADVVGKLGIVANNSFKDNDEILKFSELLSKNFKIAGASAQEQSSAMYQLTQAMGADKLQGDEFRSIMENAPLLAQAIAKEMKVPIGQLKEMSSEGLITADIIKSALFNSADEINEKYEKMPVTFSEAVTKMKNHLTNKLQPAFQKMSKWLNSEKGEAAINKVIDAMTRLAGYIPAVYDGFNTILNVITSVYNFIMKYQNVILFFGTFALSLVAVTKAVLFLRSAFAVLQIAALLFSGTLMVTPIGWFLAGISAIIAAITLLWKNWNKVKEFFGAKNSKVNFEANITGNQPTNPKKGRQSASKAKGAVSRHATGTSYFQGGLTRINEGGRNEAAILPGGTQIIPADKTAKIYGKGKNKDIILNLKVIVQGNVIGNEEFANEVGVAVVGKVKAAFANM